MRGADVSAWEEHQRMPNSRIATWTLHLQVPRVEKRHEHDSLLHCAEHPMICRLSEGAVTLTVDFYNAALIVQKLNLTEERRCLKADIQEPFAGKLRPCTHKVKAIIG